MDPSTPTHIPEWDVLVTYRRMSHFFADLLHDTLLVPRIFQIAPTTKFLHPWFRGITETCRVSINRCCWLSRVYYDDLLELRLWLFLDGVCCKKNWRNRPLEERSLHGDNIKMNLKEPEWESVYWLYLAQDRDKSHISAFFWYITLFRVVIPYRRFGTTYRVHLQGSRIKELGSSPMKMGPIGCTDTLVLITTRCVVYQMSPDVI